MGLKQVENYAVVKDGIVVNIVVWDGITEHSIDGILVKATVDAVIGSIWDGENFYPPVRQQPLEPDWKQFNLQMMGDAEYNRIITQTTNQLAARRLEAIAMSNTENFPLIVLLWNAVVEGITSTPSIEAIGSWNVIAQDNFMPFRFDEAGKLAIV